MDKVSTFTLKEICCLYLKLLYQHVDNISQEAVPQIFRQKKSKKIGIRSQDLQDSIEKLIMGCGIVLSSPRLVVPAAIYGLWILSHQYVSSDLFDFQLVPAMVGLFVYKAAALVQVSRCLAFGFSISRASPPSATSSGLAGAVCALPVQQHDRIWELYLVFVSHKGMPVQTLLRVYRRYLLYDPTHVEDFIAFLIDSELWQEAAERLASVLDDDQFRSIKGKMKHRLWLELCDLLTKNAKEVSGINVDAIIRGGINKFTDEVGRLWTSLVDYYIKRELLEKARDVFAEGMQTVVTVRDFSVIFDAYAQFEESMLAYKMRKRRRKERMGGWEMVEEVKRRRRRI